jgi:hypothetical protein
MRPLPGRPRRAHGHAAQGREAGEGRSLGIEAAINIIADPDWDEERFRIVRDWCMDVPEVVNISRQTRPVHSSPQKLAHPEDSSVRQS